MKWFFRWLADKCQAACDDKQFADSVLTCASTPERLMRIRSSGMNFVLYRANGGYIVEYQQYNEKLDRHHTALHVITNEQELGNEIGKIVVLEMLRN